MMSLVIINGVVYDIVSCSETSVCERCVFGEDDLDCPRLAELPVLVCAWLDNEDDATHYFLKREVLKEKHNEWATDTLRRFVTRLSKLL